MFVNLSTPVAVLASLVLAIFYVVSLYIWPQKFHRNHPTCVKQRILSAVMVTLAAPLYLMLWSYYSEENRSGDSDLMKWIGFTNPVSAIYPLAITVLLFAGPLFQQLTKREGLLSEYDSYTDIILIRNLIIAPITEEIVFRGCLAPLLTPAVGWNLTVLTLPLFFGVAHIHHAIELYLRGSPLPEILLKVVIQTLFTSVFGAFSTLIFLSTGSVLGPIVCHMFCNMMGLPDLTLVPHSPYPKLTMTVYVPLIIYIKFKSETGHGPFSPLWVSPWNPILSRYVAGLCGFIYVCPSVLDCVYGSMYCEYRS